MITIKHFAGTEFLNKPEEWISPRLRLPSMFLIPIGCSQNFNGDDRQASPHSNVFKKVIYNIPLPSASLQTAS